MNRIIWILLLVVTGVVILLALMQSYVVKKEARDTGVDKARDAKEAKRLLKLKAEAMGMDIELLKGLSLEETERAVVEFADKIIEDNGEKE